MANPLWLDRGGALIFRINPPSLEKVIYNRVKYASRIAEKNNTNFYYLNNGMKVSYPSKDELYYLKSILRSLFQNTFFRKLITGIAGRDIRKGIEFFLDFCKSGHINDGEILKMKQTHGTHSLPNYIVSRVVIRGNRIFYSDSDTKVKNLFYSDPSDKLPDPFVRVAILSWLNDRARIKGPSGIIGFHQVSALIKDLTILGHAINNINSELITLIKNSLIISESQNSDIIDSEELISINAPGVVHLELLYNVDYLSSCSEDIWYNKQETAEYIASRISDKGSYSHLSLHTTLLNSQVLIDYLQEYSNEYYSVQKSFLSPDNYIEPVNFSKILKSIDQFRKTQKIGFSRFFPIDTCIKAKIVNIFDYGILCELENTSQIGLLNARDIDDPDFYDNEVYTIGQEIEVIVKGFKDRYNKYDLVLKT